MKYGITIGDYILLPFYLTAIYLVAAFIRNKLYPIGNPLRRFFLPALTVKILGAIAIGMIYNYYYRGGDTFDYFTNIKLINNSITHSFTMWQHLMAGNEMSDDPVEAYINSQLYFKDIDTFTVVRIGCILGLVSFSKYLIIAVLFAAIAFTGFWALFVTLVKQYPSKIKEAAIACLFVPSSIIWGSGLFKDTICMFALGWITYSFYAIFKERKIKLYLLGLTVLCVYLLFAIKIYILACFLPIICLQQLFVFTKNIATNKARFVAFTLLAIIFYKGGTYTYNKIKNELGKYSVEKIAEYAKDSKDYFLEITDNNTGSSYNLGDFEPTIQGMLSKFWSAVNVTLFRPYLWEAKNPLSLFSALESTLFLCLFIRILFTKRIHFFVIGFIQDANFFFWVVFILCFSFFIGVSIYNFGALVRYKIPVLPFFSFILLYFNNITQIKASIKNESDISIKSS